MATNITYNGVYIQDVLTEGIDYNNEPDKTGVDPLFTRAKLSFKCILHNLPQATLGVSHGTNIAANLNSVLRKLMEPRKRFIMTIGGQTLFDVQPAHVRTDGPLNGRDVNNGPKPSVKVLNIIGDTSARIEFTIELAIPNCGGEGNGGYLNLRYWIAEDIDANWRTTRVFRGRLRAASRTVSVHAFRYVVAPPHIPGFQRESINLRESDDGLELDFEIRDVEKYAAAPFPATKWRGNHMVVSPYDGAAMCESELRVELEGPNSVHKTRLIALAASIINKKLHYLERRAASPQTVHPMYIAFNEDLAENKVDAVARIRHTGPTYAFAIELGSLGNFLPADVNLATSGGGPAGQTIIYDPYRSPPPFPTASLANIFLTLVQTPCEPFSPPEGTNTSQLSHPAYGGQALGPTVSITYGPLPPWQANQSPSHLKAAYTLYRAESEIEVTGGQIALPIARQAKLANKQDTVALVQLHQGVARRIVEIDAERIGEWPQLPKPIDYTDENGIKHRVLDHAIMPPAPELAGDVKTNIFRVSMRIEYSMSRPPKAGESLPVGNLPYRTPDGGVSPTNKIPYPYFEDPKKLIAS